MPPPKSLRGEPVTTAPFTQPFESPTIPLGVKGLNLTDDMEAVDSGEYIRLTNTYHRADHALTSRPGLTQLCLCGSTNAHSVARLNDPFTAAPNNYTRIWGAGTNLYRRQDTAGILIDSGFSGDPLCFLPHRPTIAEASWMLVADRSRMRNVKSDGTSLPLGLPAPSVAPTTVLDTQQQTPIATFNSGGTDATGAANWTGVAGFDYTSPPFPTGIPTASDGATPDVQFLTNPSADVDYLKNGYYSTWGLAKTLNLALLSSSGAIATDDDLFHTFIKVSHPNLTDEVRVYFICSATFSADVLPGSQDTVNADFYVKSWRKNDYAQFVAAQQSQSDASNTRATIIANNQLLAGQTDSNGDPIPLQDLPASVPPNTDLNAIFSAQDPTRSIADELGSGSQWVEYGIVGNPTRRGDFARVGNTSGRDWSTITGIILYLQTSKGTDGPVAMSFRDMYLHGGSGIDSSLSSLQLYDWRYTHYDPRTGAEGNPSPTMDSTLFVGTARRGVVLTPTARGDTNVRQRFYRRGGSLLDDWYFDGVTLTDGGTFTSVLSDDAISTAGTVALDHYEGIPTVDSSGNTVLAQAVACLFGPYNGLIFAVGDPYRPGHVAFCLPGEPDHWPATFNAEVCPPSEELMAGCLYGGQPFVFSRERGYVLYPSFGANVSVTSAPTGCRRGLVSRWGLLTSSRGIFGVAKDGIFRTGGGPETLITKDIEPLFLNTQGTAVHGYLPVDFTVPTAIRLVELEDEIYFQYQDTAGAVQILIYNHEGSYWRHYQWAGNRQGSALAMDEGNPVSTLLVGDLLSGNFYTHTGYADGSDAIAALAQTGGMDYGRPREDKLLGDQILEVDRQGLTITLQNVLNGETTTNPAQTLSEGSGRVQAIFDSFGTSPQHARTISTILSWISSTTRPFLYKLGVAILPQPDLTINRMTQWDDLGHTDEKWVTGITIDCDTGGIARTIVIQGDQQGAVVTLATLTVNHSGRHKKAYSWPGVDAQMVRIQPNDSCIGWMLFRADWIWQGEPPRISGWDTFFEPAGDTYYTGIDLVCDTFGAAKTLQFYVDEVLIDTQTVTAAGRLLKHITLPWGRGHVYRMVSTDANPGMLYSYKWMLAAEPGEQTNWNQNFDPVGTVADKWFKAFLFEVDTFGQNKTVGIEIDGVVVENLTVNTNGRRVVQLALSQQRLGRILRVFPSDNFPSRPYQIIPIFDAEPYSLTRWETQEGDDGIPGYKTWMWGNISLVSTADVTLTMTIQRSQSGTGNNQTLTYTLPSTAGLKLDLYVPFQAVKGVKRKYLFTSASAFRLYREESTVVVSPWGSGSPAVTHPFGNDDLDVTRGMVSASLAAARSGGGTA